MGGWDYVNGIFTPPCLCLNMGCTHHLCSRNDDLPVDFPSGHPTING